MLWASIGGMSAFFASSLVSSFALRSIQNGIAFFLVFSIAIYEVVKMGRRGAERRSRSIDVKPRPALAICMIAAVMMLAYSGSKAVGEYYLYAAQRTAVFEQSERYARTSLKFDPSNASAYVWLAAGHASEHDHAGAAALLSEGIQRGIGVSITYSDLAKYQTLAGDPAAAERTLNEAIRIFPRSVFLRVRFATFLEDAGRPVVPFTAFSYNGSAVACAQTAGAKCIFGANPAWLSSEAIKLAVQILDTGKKPAQRDQLVRADFVTSDPFTSKLFPDAKMQKIEVGKNVFPDQPPGLTLPVTPSWMTITAAEAAVTK